MKPQKFRIPANVNSDSGMVNTDSGIMFMLIRMSVHLNPDVHDGPEYAQGMGIETEKCSCVVNEGVSGFIL